MNKKGVIILIVFLSVVCLTMISTFIYLLSSDFEWSSFSFNYEGKLVDSIEYENDAEALVIDTKSLDVYVEEAAGDSITLEVYSNRKNIDYSFNNEDKKITLKAYNNTKGAKFIFGINYRGKVVVKLPKENNIQEFNIEHKVGDIKIGSFATLNGTIKNSVGDLKIDELNNAKIELTTGDIRIKKINNVDIQHSTGDVDINDVNEAIIKSNTGDIRVKNVTAKFEITGKTGDVRIDKAEITADSFIDHKTGDIRINEIKNAYIETTSKIGDVKVNNNDRYSELTVKIKNKTGDIKVN